jgi:hypothetical protein
MSPGIKLGIILLLLWVSLSSCSLRRVDFNEPITPQDLSFITVGTTRLHQVVDYLGAPEDITMPSDRLVAEFRWSKTRSSSLDLGHLFKLISPISPPFTLSGTSSDVDRLLITCDHDFIVRSYAFSLVDEHPLIEFWPF